MRPQKQFRLMNKAAFIAVPSQLAVTYRAVGDLIPDPRNARTHPKRQIDQLKSSIEAFGFINPILADPEGHIIAGHGRLQAARAMGWDLLRSRPSSCRGFRRSRSERSGSPIIRSRSMPALFVLQSHFPWCFLDRERSPVWGLLRGRSAAPPQVGLADYPILSGKTVSNQRAVKMTRLTQADMEGVRDDVLA
jgi:ParB-like nuclease domain